MKPEVCLEIFLKRNLSTKLGRFLGFISVQKRQLKFLHAIYHELEESLDPLKKVSSIPDIVLDESGYLFKPPDTFGKLVVSLREILNTGLRQN